MQFEYDPEKLIEEVEKRPGIWDYDHADYKIRNIRYKLWNDIVKELMECNVKLTKMEMRELEIQLQKKWKSIKDCFHKYLSNPNKGRRPYIYAKKLQFLLKNQELREVKKRNSENASSESEEDTKSKVWRPRKKIKVIKYEDRTSDEDVVEIGENDPQDQRDDSNDGTEANSMRTDSKTNKPTTEEFAFANVDVPKYDNDDSDKMFLMSLLPHLKSVREELKINVKMELMQVLCNANYSAAAVNKLI